MVWCIEIISSPGPAWVQPESSPPLLIMMSDIQGYSRFPRYWKGRNNQAATEHWTNRQSATLPCFFYRVSEIWDHPIIFWMKEKAELKQWNHFYFYSCSVSEFLRTLFASELKTSDSFYPQFLLESIHISLELKEFQAMTYLDFESHQFDLSEP